MGCEEMPKTSNEYDESNKNNLDKSDLNINISNDNDNSDKEVEDFFSLSKNKEELSVFYSVQNLFTNIILINQKCQIK